MKKAVQEGWNQWRKSSGVIKKKKSVSKSERKGVYNGVAWYEHDSGTDARAGQAREQ